MVQVRRGFKTWCENAARSYRREMGQPPDSALDPRQLAKKLGIDVIVVANVIGLEEVHKVRLTNGEGHAWSAATLRDGKRSLIIVNEGQAVVRQNNSIAHEIGHIALEHKAPRMIMLEGGLMVMADYDAVMEQEATIFAGAVLAPREALLGLISKGMTNHEIANYLGVSTSLIEMRKNITGIGFQLARRQRGTWIP
jgi:Zn-dependent peptidase ImmA (M78 family)